LPQANLWSEPQIDIRERADGTPTSSGKTIESQLASWLVEQLDARTVAAIAWQVMRRLTGLSKRLAIHLAAQSRLFEPLTAHSERLLIALSDEFYEAMGHHKRPRARSP
jgi:hypothetical protein